MVDSVTFYNILGGFVAFNPLYFPKGDMDNQSLPILSEEQCSPNQSLTPKRNQNHSQPKSHSIPNEDQVAALLDIFQQVLDAQKAKEG